MPFCLIQDWVEPETERSTTNYDAISARLTPLAGDAPGFIAHAAGFTGSGFRIIEYWDTREDCERFMKDHVMPAVIEVSGAGAPPPVTTAFELHNLVTA